MAYDGFETLGVRCADGVASITFDHPPINLMDIAMMRDLDRLGRELEADDAIRAAVFRSANPDFFIAHADVELILRLPRDAPEPTAPSSFHRIVERFRTMPLATIGMVEGRARGGGSEFLLSLDMRFAAIGRAVFGQPEVALGILPGGSGTQRLPRLMGRGRALEAILGCGDFDARTAERYGWINRALPPEELLPFVMDLARRIASFPKQAIALAKAAVDAADTDVERGLTFEAGAFDRTLRIPETQQRMQAFLDAGGQQPEVERDLERVYAALEGKD